MKVRSCFYLNFKVTDIFFLLRMTSSTDMSVSLRIRENDAQSAQY